MKISQDVVQRLVRRDETAFNETYYAYVRLIHYLVYTLVKDHAEAEDVVQEAFVKMYENVGGLADPARFQAWFVRLAENLAFDHLRRRKADPAADAARLDEDVADRRIGFAPAKFDFNGMLEPFENHVLNLHLVHRMTFREIAGETGRTMSVVTKAYYGAVATLKKQYRKGAL